MKSKLLSKISFSVLPFAFLSACASVNSVSLSPIPAKRDRVVQAEATRFIILGFNFDNDYVDQIHQSFRAQCPGGVISGILTKDEVISYFLAHKRRVIATGFCNQPTQARSGQQRSSASEQNSPGSGASDEMLGL